jgi:hypothetical protein
MAITANATFPGITVIMACEGTFTHGISPSVFTLRTVPHTNFIAKVGDLIMAFGSNKLTLKDCAVDAASLEVNDDGTEWTINILDRRWRWKFGEISGWYNRRLADGTVEKATEKKPQELAKLLLEAMGEQGFDVAALPNDPRPEVRWSFDNPAEELASLCDELSCRVVLGLDNKVKIWKLGDGGKLPQGGAPVSGGGQGFDTSVVPTTLKVVGSPIRYQSKFLLEAVGEDTDGKIKLIDDLSYKPASGWGDEDPAFFDGVTSTYKVDGIDVDCRLLALKSVFRWYRVKEQAGGGLKPPGFDEKFKVEKLEQLLPLGDGLIDTATDIDGRKVPKPAEITGEWYGYTEDDELVTRGSRYRESFGVDVGKGIVRFANPVFNFGFFDDTVEAELYLYTSYSVTNPTSRDFYHFTRERKMPDAKGDTKPYLVRRPEIERTIRQAYDQLSKPKGNPIDNLKDVQKEADYYLDAAQKEFETDVSLTLEYAGLMFIPLDGLTTQISWRMGNGQPATTTASQNDEHDIYTPPFAERREKESIKAVTNTAKVVRGRTLFVASTASKFVTGS